MGAHVEGECVGEDALVVTVCWRGSDCKGEVDVGENE